MATDDLDEYSHWNYRVLRRTFPDFDEVEFNIYEVYYDGQGRPTTRTSFASSPGGYSLDELRNALRLQLDALDKPVLDFETMDEIK